MLGTMVSTSPERTGVAVEAKCRISVSFRYRLTKLRSRPSSWSRCRLSPVWVAMRSSSTWPTVSPASSRVSRPAVNGRSGVGMETVTDMSDLAQNVDGLRTHGRPVVGQHPAGQVAGSGALHLDDDIAVPGPGLGNIEGRRRGGMVGVRVIATQHLQPG